MDNLFLLLIGFSFILFIAEMLTPGTFFFFSFAIGSLISAFAALFTKDIPTLIIIASIIAIISFLLLKKFDIFKLKKLNTETNIDSYIGKTASVISIGENNSYRVKIFGEEWTAFCDTPLSIGDIVKIVNRESLILSVTKL